MSIMNLNTKNSVLKNLLGFRPISCQALHTTRFTSQKSYYDVLQLKSDCNAKEIRESFLNLAKKCHPDTNPEDPGNHARFVELQRAYSVLSVPAKRLEYDSLRNHTPNSPRRGPFKSYDGSGNEDVNYSEEFKRYYYQSRQTNTDETPPLRVGAVKVTLFLLAFTAAGAFLQYYFLKWLYRRHYNEEMERHRKGSASFYALKQEMDNRAEEYDLAKLRAAYFKEAGSSGSINMHLIPSMIRPRIPQPLQKPSQLETKESATSK